MAINAQHGKKTVNKATNLNLPETKSSRPVHDFAHAWRGIDYAKNLKFELNKAKRNESDLKSLEFEVEAFGQY